MNIVSLATVPAHLPTVAGWIHAAFWQDSGQSQGFIAGLLKDHLADTPLPQTFVACVDDQPVGSVSFIAHDMPERPALTPWLAALYVLPEYRRRGFGRQLVNHLIDHAINAGFKHLFLSADDQVLWYKKHGFEIVETTVGAHRLTVMCKHLTKTRERHLK